MSTNNSPNLPTIFDSATCTRKGLCPVSSIRNKGDPLESHSLYFEQHGNGPEKILFIMGWGRRNLLVSISPFNLIACTLQFERQLFCMVAPSSAFWAQPSGFSIGI